MKKLIIAIGAIALTSGTFAQQERHFSMWFENAASFNPAAVGTMETDFDLFANFRYQWFTVSDTPFQSASATFQSKLMEGGLSNGWFGLGVTGSNDISGDSKYMVNDVRVPISYQIELDGYTNVLGIGISPGLYSRSINSNELTWDNQWTGTSFDQSMNSGETQGTAASTNFDLGAGIHWLYRPDRNTRIFAGASANHLLRQDITFVGVDKLYRNINVNAGMNYRADNASIGISPQVLAMFQGPNRNIVAGLNIDNYLKNRSQITSLKSATIVSFGLYYRVGDAAILNFMYQYSGFKVGAAFDVNLSGLTPASRAVGGFELFLRYSIEAGKSRKYIR